MSDAPPDLLVDTLGMRTPVWRYGPPDGEPIVFVHGFRGDHHGLEGMARALAAREPASCVLVPDLPGFGVAPAVPGRIHDLDLFGAWLRAFVAAAAPGGGSILGHSFGTLVVANALAQGLEARSVTLVNPISAPALAGPKAALTRLAIFYYWAADHLPEGPARALLSHPVIVRVMSVVMAKTKDPALRAWIHAQHDRYFSRFADTRTLLQAFTASVSHTVPEYAARIAQPTLLIAGDRDDITPLTAQLGLQRQLADARLRVLPGVGHLVHYEAVDAAIDELARFLHDRDTAGAGEHG